MLPRVPLATVSDWKIALRLRGSLLNNYARWKLDGKWLVHPLQGGGEVRICCCLVVVNGAAQRKLGLLPSLIVARAYRRRLLAELEQAVTF